MNKLILAALMALAACAPAPTTQELNDPYNTPKPVASKAKPIPPAVVDFGPATVIPTGPKALEGDCTTYTASGADGYSDAWTTCTHD